MKRMLWLLLILLLLIGCTESHLPPSPDTSSPKTSPERVIALSSSIAEIWLLAGGELVGVTSDALDGRISVPANIPVVGTVKDPNVETILSLKPDLVLLSQDITSHLEIQELLKTAGITSYCTKVETRDDYLSVLKDFSDLTEDLDCYQRNGVQVMEAVDHLLSNLPDSISAPPPTALFLRAYSTGIKVKAKEHTVCYILEDIGVENIAAREGLPLEELSLEAILQADPDYIFIVLMGDEDAATENIKESLEENPVWQQLSAVQNKRMIILPKDLYHYKPNDRWGEAYETLLEIVYPEWYP